MNGKLQKWRGFFMPKNRQNSLKPVSYLLHLLHLLQYNKILLPACFYLLHLLLAILYINNSFSSDYNYSIKYNL